MYKEEENEFKLILKRLYWSCWNVIIELSYLSVDVIQLILIFRIVAFEESLRQVFPKRRKLLIKKSLCSKVLGQIWYCQKGFSFHVISCNSEAETEQ